MVFDLSNMAINIIAAIIIILLGLILGKFSSKVTQVVLTKLKINKISKLELEVFISLVVRYVIYFGAIIIALNQLGITNIIIDGLLIIILLSIVIFIIFTLKEFIPNFIAGYLIRKKGKLKIGDKIKIKSLEGTVQRISWIETKVKTKNNDIVYVPNFNLIKSNI